MNLKNLLIKIITSDGKDYDFYKTDSSMHHADACKEVHKLNLTDADPDFFVYAYLSSICKNGHIAFMRDSFELFNFGLLFLPGELTKEQYIMLKDLLIKLNDYKLEITLFDKDNEITILDPNLRYCEQRIDVEKYCKIKKH